MSADFVWNYEYSRAHYTFRFNDDQQMILYHSGKKFVQQDALRVVNNYKYYITQPNS